MNKNIVELFIENTMKRLTLLTASLFSLICLGFALNTNLAFAEEEEDYPPVKGIIIDIGSGANGVAFALGFRYSFASLSFGLAGFATDIPNYSQTPPTGTYFYANKPLPTGYEEDKYSGLLVSIDAGYHFDYFYPYTFFATVGFYTQQDSILAKEVRNDGRAPNRYSYKVENSNGLAFGLGGNYQVSDYVALGLGVHNKRGIYGQFMYTW